MNITTTDLAKKYNDTDGLVLKGVSHTFESGSFTAIMGKSGSGKSTLLSLISGLCRPTSGHVFYDDVDFFKLSDSQRSKFRALNTATIFQDYNLLDFLTAEENIIVSHKLAKTSKGHGGLSPKESLGLVGMESFSHKYPNSLSGGQRQRVAIARAISIGAKIIFADEPTGALDEENSAKVVSLLKSIKEKGTTVVMVTHDPYIACCADCVINISNGLILKTVQNPTVNDLLKL